MSQEQFVKAVIRQRIKIDDPEVYDTIVDIIYKFVMLLQYGDNDIRKMAIDAVFQVLPEEVTVDIMRHYIDRIKRRYSIIKDMVKDLGFDTSGIKGKGIEDMFISFMLETFKNQYFTQPKQQDSTQDGNVAKKIDAKTLPEELKQILMKQ